MNRSELKKAVKGAQQGDREAVELLYNEWSGRLTRFIRSKIGNADAAEDILSETFVSVMEHIGDLKTPEAFGGWIYAVASRKCINWLNRENQREDLAENEISGSVPLPEDQVADEELHRKLESIIADLKPEQRSAVVLYYYEQCSIGEVAKAIGKSESATRKILQRARNKLRKQIEKLSAKGTAFSFVPTGIMINGIFDDSYHAASVSVKGARVTGFGMGVKAVAVGVFAASSLAVPVGLSRFGGNYRPNGDSFSGDERDAPIIINTDDTDTSSAERNDKSLETVRITADVKSYKDGILTFEYDNREYSLPFSADSFDNSNYHLTDIGISEKIINNTFGIPVKADIEISKDMTEIAGCDVEIVNGAEPSVYDDHPMYVRRKVYHLYPYKGSVYRLASDEDTFYIDLNSYDNIYKAVPSENEEVGFYGVVLDDDKLFSDVLWVIEDQPQGSFCRLSNTLKYHYLGTVQAVLEDRVMVRLNLTGREITVPPYLTDGEIREGAEVAVTLNDAPGELIASDSSERDYAVFFTDLTTLLPEGSEFKELAYFQAHQGSCCPPYDFTRIDEVT